MNTSTILQLPNSGVKSTLHAVLDKLSADHAWNEVSVAVAYSSVAGARCFYDAVHAHREDVRFRWLVGLDDFITQPGVIDFCLNLPNSVTKVYSSPGNHTRFHPKIYLFDDKRNKRAVSIIGSANLTYAALNTNCEAVSVLSSESTNETERLREFFDCAWSLGTDPDEQLMAKYRATFEKLKTQRSFVLQAETLRVPPKKRGEVLVTDGAQVDPSTASICWIEVGKNTALGRELEFKAEQALFFGLDQQGQPPQYREFVVSDGRTVPMRLKFQGNSMWRLQLSRDVPEVATGLRPALNGRLGRSPFVAVFERTSVQKRFVLKFIKDSSLEYKRLKRITIQHGTLGHTSTRQYGWY